MGTGATNVELLRQAYESFNRTGPDAFASLLAPELDWLESPRAVALVRSRREEVLARMSELGWSGWSVEPEDFVSFGERVVVPVREAPRSPGRDAPAERTRAHYWELQDGRVVRLEVYAKRADAVNAAAGYFSLLERIHGRLRPRTYVEIGVHAGRSLARARPGTRLVGIDPAPIVTDPRIERAAKLFRQTSDAFFAAHDLRSELGGLPVDLAFVDGMHLFEFALRDFVNLEACCSERSVILVHDCYPNNRVQADRDRTTEAWSGDVWKLVACLRAERPELNVAVIDVRPAGLGVITGLDPSSRVLRDRLADVTERYLALDYDWVDEDKAERLGRIEHDWDTIEALLPPPFDHTVEDGVKELA